VCDLCLQERKKLDKQAKKESRDAFRLQTALVGKKIKSGRKQKKTKQHGVKKLDTTDKKVKRLQ
jgi:hypothetical protein